MVRVLNREELKIEISKFKNIRLKIVKDYQKNGVKIPGFAGKLAQEMEEQKNDGKRIPVGMKAEKVEKASNSEDFEGSMFGDNISEVPELEEDVPPQI